MTETDAAHAPTTLDLAGLPWREVEIAGSTPPVRLTRLEVDDGGGFTVVVRFPPGWARPGPGSYDAIEEVLFLAGSFEMSGVVHTADDYAWFPAGFTRVGSRSAAGALALAWFSGRDRWSDGIAATSEVAARGVVRTRWTEVEPTVTPLGIPGRLLRSGADRSAWMLDALPDGVVVPSALAWVDVFDLVTHRYHHVPSGVALPPVDPGPAWVRTIPSGS
jgi:hypothetical protein